MYEDRLHIWALAAVAVVLTIGVGMSLLLD